MAKFQKRAFMLLLGLSVWALVIIGRLYFYTVYASQHYVQKGNRQAWRKGIIQAVRGRILDKNGVPLAWTEKFFDLFYYSDSSDSCKKVEAQVNSVIQGAHFKKLSDSKYCVKKDLTPDELVALSSIVPRITGLRIVSRLKRRVVDCPKARAYLGQTRVVRNSETGVDGVEAGFDKQLTGVNGEYIVMLDRTGGWIPGSYQVIKETEDGNDICLEMTLEEINSLKNEK